MILDPATTSVPSLTEVARGEASEIEDELEARAFLPAVEAIATPSFQLRTERSLSDPFSRCEEAMAQCSHLPGGLVQHEERNTRRS